MTRAKGIVGLAVAAAACLLSPIGAAASAGTNPPPVAAASTNAPAAWGIEIEGLHLSAGGHVVDFRYKVIDADKAAPLGDLKNKAFLIDEASGQAMRVPSMPKVGSLRQRGAKMAPGRVYFMLFANAGRAIKPGSKVTVTIGDFKVEGLTVE